MGAAADPRHDADRALAYVCQRLDYLRRHLGPDSGVGTDSPGLRAPTGTAAADQPSEAPELRALTRMVSAGQSPDPGELRGVLEVLDQAVQAAGDPLGVWQASVQWHTIEQRGLRPAGIPVDAPFEICYLCPLGRCAGRQPDQSTVFPLTCTISGRELKREKP